MKGSFRPRAHVSSTSAERVRASSRMPMAATLQRPLATRGNAIISLKQSAADSRSKIELQTGIRMTSAKATTRARSKPRRQPGVSRTTWRTPAGGRSTRFGSTAQPTIGALFGRSRRLRERSHDCVDCWRSTSPSITGTPLFAKCAARWVASVLLPLPPLRLTTAMTDMTGRFGPILHGNRPGQNVTAGPERGKGTVVFSIRAGNGGRQSAEKGRPDRPLHRFTRPGMSGRDGLFSDEAGVRRCAWCQSSPAYRDYHDREWGFPVDDDTRLFEKMCLEGFQAGLSWLTILNKREAFRRAFAGFDAARVARFGAKDIERLLGDAGIVRHRGKIESAINNARRVLELRAEV